MKNILVINGHQKHPFAEGLLNQTIFENIVEFLAKQQHEIKTTVITKGYIEEEEQDKFLWADTIIFQSPVFWFSLPGAFKTYIDKIYAEGIFFDSSVEKYGQGGLLKGKKYMYSLTWDTPEEEFNGADPFFEGKSLDEFIMHLHKIQQYCGMEPLKTFSLFSVDTNPQIPKDLEKLQKHLEEVLGNK